MDGRDAFLTMARERHYEFSSFRRTKFSSMAMLYELHTQSQDKFVYTCNNCKKNVETRFHCSTCDVSIHYCVRLTSVLRNKTSRSEFYPLDIYAYSLNCFLLPSFPVVELGFRDVSRYALLIYLVFSNSFKRVFSTLISHVYHSYWLYYSIYSPVILRV